MPPYVIYYTEITSKVNWIALSEGNEKQNAPNIAWPVNYLWWSQQIKNIERVPLSESSEPKHPLTDKSIR